MTALRPNFGHCVDRFDILKADRLHFLLMMARCRLQWVGKRTVATVFKRSSGWAQPHVRSRHAYLRTSRDLEHLHDSGMVWPAAIPELDNRDSHIRRMGDRAARILFRGTSQPHRLRPRVHGRSAQDHAGNHHHVGICGVRRRGPEGTADVAVCWRIYLHRGRSCLHVRGAALNSRPANVGFIARCCFPAEQADRFEKHRLRKLGAEDTPGK